MMSSQENPGVSSSRGTAIPMEATTGTSILGNRIEDVDIALGQPTAGDFKLEFLPEIDDPEGDYKVHVAQLLSMIFRIHWYHLASELYKKITGEIIDQFYEAEFQRLESACV